MREVEEDGDEGVQGGLEDEAEEDATEEDLILDLSGVHVEVVDSTHEGTKWLIVYGVHICHKQRGQVENLQSALEMVKMVQVPFCHLMSSTGGQDGEVKVFQMTDPEGHRCSKDKTGVILHKFKMKLKERMQSTLDENWSKIWKDPYLSAFCL